MLLMHRNMCQNCKSIWQNEEHIFNFLMFMRKCVLWKFSDMKLITISPFEGLSKYYKEKMDALRYVNLPSCRKIVVKKIYQSFLWESFWQNVVAIKNQMNEELTYRKRSDQIVIYKKDFKLFLWFCCRIKYTM